MNNTQSLNPCCNGSSINGLNPQPNNPYCRVLILIVMDHLLTEKLLLLKSLMTLRLNPYCNGSSINGPVRCSIECNGLRVLILIVMDHLLTVLQYNNMEHQINRLNPYCNGSSINRLFFVNNYLSIAY